MRILNLFCLSCYLLWTIQATASPLSATDRVISDITGEWSGFCQFQSLKKGGSQKDSVEFSKDGSGKWIRKIYSDDECKMIETETQEAPFVYQVKNARFGISKSTVAFNFKENPLGFFQIESEIDVVGSRMMKEDKFGKKHDKSRGLINIKDDYETAFISRREFSRTTIKPEH